jgi:hypothetical protein
MLAGRAMVPAIRLQNLRKSRRETPLRDIISARFLSEWFSMSFSPP